MKAALQGVQRINLAIMAPPSPPIDEWLESLPPWAQWGIQGSKLLLAFSPIIILIVILVRAFESDEEVRFISCCFSYPPRGGSRFAAAQIADAGAHFRRYTGESEAKKEDGLPGP